MKKYKIALLPGDGVGKEVINCAYKVLKAVGIEAIYIYSDIGWEYWKSEGNPLPERTVQVLRNTDCALLGAITSKPEYEAQRELNDELKDKGFQYKSPIIQLRQMFELSTNIRPCKSIKGNKAATREDVDITVFRENTEGLYSGIEYSKLTEELYNCISTTYPSIQQYKKLGIEKTAVSMRIMCVDKSEKIIREAFQYAVQNKKRKVTVADKPNILRATGGMFIDTARRVAKDYPDIILDEANIDALCMWLVKDPSKYEVIVAENLFGDIISDLTAQLAGGMGFAFSGNIGSNYAVFEPTHGSAPKYAGMNKVNPIATILAAAYMLKWLGEDSKYLAINQAVEQVTMAQKIGTYDMGFTNSNLELTNQVIVQLKSILNESTNK